MICEHRTKARRLFWNLEAFTCRDPFPDDETSVLVLDLFAEVQVSQHNVKLSLDRTAG